MSLYYKTLLIITLTFIGLVAILYFVSQTILLNSFVELENRNVRQNVERGAAALLDDLSELSATAGDWAPWDETYNFVETPTEDYIQANLLDSTFSNLGLNFMLFFDNSNRLVFGKAFDLINQTETDIPQILQVHFVKNTSLLDHSTLESHLAGIILLPDQDPLLVASRPIVTSDYQGPIHGTLILGRYIDAEQVKALAEETRLDVSIERFGKASLPDEAQLMQAVFPQEAAISVHPLNEEAIAGYTLIKDVYGQPALILRVDMRRDIYLQGQATFRYLILGFLVSGALFGLILLFLLNKGVVSRLTYLDKRVSEIATHTDLTARVSIAGQDEISNLAGAINTMLTALQRSGEALHQANQGLEIRVEERTAELSASNKLLKTEIEERKRIEQALALARDQALAASRLKTELLAKVSHELRTPLSVILGYVEMLQLEVYGSLNEAQKEPLHHIQERTFYLTKQVNELLDEAALEAGKLLLYSSSFNLTDILNEVNDQTQILARTKGLNFTIEVEVGMPATLSGDAHRLQQILSNLVGNAVKFTETGSVHLAIRKAGESHWEIQVTDTGPGIPAEAQPWIFEPFRQVDGSETRLHRGSGLGLSIVKQLVILMEGQILLESEVGKGSTFTVRLPLIVPHEEEN